jgi:hypothetical protein
LGPMRLARIYPSGVTVIFGETCALRVQNEVRNPDTQGGICELNGTKDWYQAQIGQALQRFHTMG